MHFENDAIVEKQGPMRRLARVGLVMVGLVVILGPVLVAGALLSPELHPIAQLIAAGVYIGFAFTGISAIRAAFAPRHDLRLDPATGLATITTYRLRRRDTVTRPLCDLGPPRVERIPRSDTADDFALHIHIAGHDPVSFLFVAAEDEAMLWARRIEALRLAAQ
ncbi:MAG: hypothetical protein AB7U46_08895 [Paenirhodobacter sp.]|uniref:hypothetical protein n=1 Tax=Paenirhodobacter sp. TaxID=1965326 RepID=UPI003D141EA4